MLMKRTLLPFMCTLGLLVRLAPKTIWRAVDESIGGESLDAEEVPLIDTGLPNTEEYDMEFGRAPSFKKKRRSKLGLLPLVALIFYEVSGGPFGTEVGPTILSHGCHCF